MIGIVVVSHSRALADAAVALATGMFTGEGPAIAVAAGLDETTFGTDAAAVASAIEQADSPDGVLVLLDLGSALLSAEMALEFVGPDIRDRVQLTGAPLVEGLVAAVVLAATGAPLEAVADEARRGLVAKQEHLGDTPAAAAETKEPAQRIEVPVPNPHGLHARPAARLVSVVRSFDARVTLTNLTTGRGPVDAASLSLVATLDARQGHRLRVAADGPDAEATLAAVAELAATGFGDLVAPAAAAEPGNFSSPGDEELYAEAAGSGLDIAIGPAIVPATEVDMSGYVAGDAATERSRSAEAVTSVAADLERVRGDAPEGAIFDAHLALLDDPEVTAQVSSALDAGTPAPQAWSDVLDRVAARFEALEDPYQRARAQDIRAVRRRVLAALAGEPPDTDHARGILVVPEIDPATAATVDAEAVQGIATRAGGATGHGVIVAKSRGIPIITDIGSVAVGTGQLVAFDARTGRFLVDPDPATEREFQDALDRRAELRRTAIADTAAPAETLDGHRIAVLANVGSVADARAAAELGAEGSGLVRTEVLFGDRATAPSIDEQVETYLAIAAALRGRPITIRTWDVGGDKPLPFLPLPAEPNPFLGERGLRVFRRRPELLADQLTAVCRVAEQVPVRVMFPMVTTAEEIAWARAQLAAADPPDGLRVGVMVEVPALAVRVQQVTAGLDFVSIGTNDLTQYTTAADRGNAAVARLADALDPAVLELVGRVAQRVPEAAVCGDLASDPDAAVLLAGLGIRELSAVGPQIPMVKARLRSVRLGTAIELADHALTLGSAAEVRALLASSLS